MIFSPKISIYKGIVVGIIKILNIRMVHKCFFPKNKQTKGSKLFPLKQVKTQEPKLTNILHGTIVTNQ